MGESTSYSCDHCGSLLHAPYCQVMTQTGLKRFCCEGCEGVYRMLHEDEIVDDNPSDDGLHRS